MFYKHMKNVFDITRNFLAGILVIISVPLLWIGILIMTPVLKVKVLDFVNSLFPAKPLFPVSKVEPRNGK